MFNTENMSINERVAFYRKLRGMRQEDLAHKINMKPSSYSQMERSGEISASRLLKIAEALDISPDCLFGSANIFEQPQKEKIVVAKQTSTLPEAYQNMYYSEEEQIIDIIHHLKAKNKKRVFDLVREIYKEEHSED